MNESKCVNEVERISDVICKSILQFPIDQQNDIFGRVRATLIKERISYINIHNDKISDMRSHSDFARRSLEEVFLAPAKEC